MKAQKHLAWNAGIRLSSQLLLTQICLLFGVIFLSLWIKSSMHSGVLVFMTLFVSALILFFSIFFSAKQLFTDYGQLYCELWSSCSIEKLMKCQVLTTLLALFCAGMAVVFI